jgi:hypothetical protein
MIKQVIHALQRLYHFVFGLDCELCGERAWTRRVVIYGMESFRCDPCSEGVNEVK